MIMVRLEKPKLLMITLLKPQQMSAIVISMLDFLAGEYDEFAGGILKKLSKGIHRY